MFTDREEPLTAEELKLTLKDRALDSGSTCHDQRLWNDEEIWCLVKKPNTKDEFEDLEKVSGQVFEHEYPVKAKVVEAPAEDD
jgi:hypothetical protein